MIPRPLDRIVARLLGRAGPLPQPRIAGPMAALIAIMVFLSVLAGAAGLGLAGTSSALDRQMAGRVTIQIVAADPAVRAAEAAAAEAVVRRLPQALSVARVPDSEVASLVQPWLGTLGNDLPLPALIDVELADGGVPTLRRALRPVAPSALIDEHARWLGPVNRLVSALSGLAGALVLLIGIATAATVVLAARGALDTHRGTVEVLHLLGATDRQIARLFERRFALDALLGGVAGFLAGVAVLLMLGRLVVAVRSDLLGTTVSSGSGFALLLTVPLAAALVATVSARMTILRVLRRML
ncbi:cell division transport system permease protein [Sphingomonas jejuensis]|uniref:Cell division transport system permease protein n=1 Tax=Sphingomonas jejuensis TaxID=904715 RepID=A0ABX0XQH2_9SPHN|nr:FtsX-like permease family protein [Sphingomonas jejuensis]NJC34936.1 cell division transport system permease protein [Sphingomonas jejuensis]